MDIVAGVSVALVLIPRSVADAALTGLPPESGLSAAAVTPLVAAALASSPYLQTSPTARTPLLTLGALTAMAPIGSPIKNLGLAAVPGDLVARTSTTLPWWTMMIAR